MEREKNTIFILRSVIRLFFFFKLAVAGLNVSMQTMGNNIIYEVSSLYFEE